MLFKLARRNIWRNKRRTLITIASILFAVFFACFMNSMQKGIWNHMEEGVVLSYFGYAQIHSQGYWDEQSIDKSFDPKPVQTALKDVSEITGFTPRLESFALASYGTATKGSLVLGIDPEEEHKMSQLKDKLIAGEYLEKDDKAVLLAEGLADYFKISVGDTLVLLSQGYHGANAAGKYPVKGLVKFGSPELNKQMMYLPLKEAQWFYAAEGLTTSLVLQIEDKDALPALLKSAKEKLNLETYEVMNWEELMPEMVQARDLDAQSGKLTLGILYLIVSFGIFGTILMMTKEREYEFGVLIAIGMQRLKLSLVVWLEVIMLGLLGTLGGIMCSLPLLYYVHSNPIYMGDDMAKAYEDFGIEPLIITSLDWSIFTEQAIIILFVTSVLALYPLFTINKLKPMEAMRG